MRSRPSIAACARRLRIVAGTSSALMVWTGCAPAPTWDGNIVLIVIDTLRADALPSYGAPRENAPFLASLADGASVYENAWTTSSWTAPATASIFTSVYPNEHGVQTGLRVFRNQENTPRDMQINRIPESFDTIPTFLRGRGYRTFGASANLNVDEAMGFARGFDRFVMTDYSRQTDGRELVSAVLSWRDEILQAAPFFLYLHFMDPHVPHHRREALLPANAAAPPVLGIEDRDAYDSEVRFVDDLLRQIFESLPLDRALVIVTSDHGQEFDDHGDFGHGFQLYSELTRVPLLLHRPGGAASRVMPDVSTIDILPTLRSLTGAPRSPQDRGTSLLPGDAPAETRAVFSMRTRARDTRQKKRAVVRDGLKLIVTEPERSRELYDLRADPGETQNLAATRAEDVRRLEALLAAQNARDGLSVHERAEILEASPELVEQLEELGYADDGPQ
ncbi:MAG: sulfatase [Myxococcota bacterium]|jgi:arylsulfatase A-like enzyme|nr:hypothetical protein [Deltaproteobacteria bacterium]MCP4241741.1 sulfatase-like hydrolase/transferase [bacterium]MDP6073448.1 sulfatase [Myxococcota bacterium]MDP6244117.1 sulfatase [Myxococcota bacterium]MDP7074487.1 sulfatase [Myxococcota bacterium]